MAINIVTKKTGDLLTATEFNAVVQGIKDNENSISTLENKIDNSNKLAQDAYKKAANMVVLSQDEYDALVKAGTVDSDTYYNILEE